MPRSLLTTAHGTLASGVSGAGADMAVDMPLISPLAGLLSSPMTPLTAQRRWATAPSLVLPHNRLLRKSVKTTFRWSTSQTACCTIPY